MKQRRIGSLEVSIVGLGCNNFGRRLNKKDSAAVVNAALDAGITLFDTADIYGDGRSEEFVGRALGSRRDSVVIATKFGSSMKGRGKGASAAYIRKTIEASLRRLGTDRIDLYQLHEPDETVPIEETLGALDELVRAGKVHEIGCSNFTTDQIREADAAVRGGARFASVQNEYNLLNREPEQGVLAECERLGLAFLPYFPLASGLLTGKYCRGRPAPKGSRLAEKRFSSQLTGSEPRDRGGSDPVRRITRSHDPGAGRLLAARPTDRGVGHLRRDLTAAGAGERQRRWLGADRSGSRRDRRHRHDRGPINPPQRDLEIPLSDVYLNPGR
ncbi:hypothetical protein BH18GEM1_BH18GEM1_21060 [soil metagenome]